MVVPLDTPVAQLTTSETIILHIAPPTAVRQGIVLGVQTTLEAIIQVTIQNDKYSQLTAPKNAHEYGRFLVFNQNKSTPEFWISIYWMFKHF